ncbi:OmpA family protein [Bosea sp. 2RAB26]|uniref:OmpA family protein n=1 Tax=Bosea sp. 2RAB26 TaxID=3237476 RepID=UPI003F92DBBC
MTQPLVPPPGGRAPGASPGGQPPSATPGQVPAPLPAQPPAAAPLAPPPGGRAPGAVPPPVAPPQPGQTLAPPPAGQPPAAGPGQLPPPDRQGRRGGIGLGGAAAIGLGVGVLGGIMATQGATRLDDVRGRREERREGDVTIIREPGRTIIRDDDRAIIRRDETERFRDLGWQGRTERRGDENVTVFERPDGSRIITVTDEDGRLIRRTRRMRDGDEIVMIDNTRRDRPDMRFSDEVVVLPPPPLPIPRERYIVDAEQADQRLIYETITAPPIAAIPRRYTLDEVRYSPDLRARMRSVDIDTVTFETGSWEVTPNQAQRLSVIAASISQALQRAPNEVFLVEGHTDAVGSDVDNLSLSDRRAQSVAEILTRDFQVPPENLTTQGYGEQYLKVQTQEAARENRRVTLRRITPLLAGQNQPQ